MPAELDMEVQLLFSDVRPKRENVSNVPKRPAWLPEPAWLRLHRGRNVVSMKVQTWSEPAYLLCGKSPRLKSCQEALPQRGQRFS